MVATKLQTVIEETVTTQGCMIFFLPITCFTVPPPGWAFAPFQAQVHDLDQHRWIIRSPRGAVLNYCPKTLDW